MKNRDIRLVNGDIVALTEAIKDYLHRIKFKKNQEEITKDKAVIKAGNLQQSVIKLFLSSSPQFIQWQLKKKSKNQIEIETSFGLFKKFRVFYYTCLSVLMCGVGFFYKLWSFYSLSSQGDSNLQGLILLVAVIFLVFALMFVRKSITSYDHFVNQFYTNLATKGFGNGIILESDCSFPDIFLGSGVFLLFLFFIIISEENSISVLINIPFVPITLIILCILIFFLIVINLRPSLGEKALFSLIGISFCLSFGMLGNAPVINFAITTTDAISSLAEKGEIIYDKSSYGDYEDLQSNFSMQKKKNAKQLPKYFSGLQKSSQIKLVAILGFWGFMLFLTIFLSSIYIDLPIQVTRRLDRFKFMHPESLYYQALKPDKLSFLFNGVLVFLWVVMTVVNFSSLYYSLSIFEKTIFNTNFLFKNNISTLFFDNTKTIFNIIIQPIISENGAHFFHKITMLVHSFPILLIFFLVLRKKWIASVRNFSLLKMDSIQYNEIEAQLAGKVAKICEFAGVSIPIVKVIDSPYINAESRYVGFPFFKRILTITKGAWDELYSLDGELDALLAHEVWHLKKHTFKLRLLCLISDYTFFGNGFLAILQNFFQIEKEADEFATKWLKENDRSITALKFLLEQQEEINEIYNLSMEPSLSGSFLNFVMLKDDSYRKNFLTWYDRSSEIKKIWINLKLLYQIYFSEEILSYFHPPITERIHWIQS